MTLDNLIERIRYLMDNDEENPEKQSDTLETFYQICTDTQKKAINNAMICICGYSLETLINNPADVIIQ